MVELNKIPHIDEISNHGAFAGAREKKTATFRERYLQQNKVVPSLEDAIRRTGLKDGMTISFHHHFRNGDHIINMVVDKLAEMGYKNLTLAASSLTSVHAPLVRHIKNGVITHIETSGLRGELAEEISRGLMDCPVVFRSHGGRASAIRSGDLHIDVAFLGAPSCDPYGNANGYSRDDDNGIACGSLGYARTDARYADNVIIITNHLVAYPNAPWAIPEYDVDYVVLTDDIGDPKGIMSGATRYTKDPKELLIAKTAANIIEATGYLYDGFSMQMGSGGASLATARFLRQKMIDQGYPLPLCPGRHHRTDHRHARGGSYRTRAGCPELRFGRGTLTEKQSFPPPDRRDVLRQPYDQRCGGSAGLRGPLRTGDRHRFQCQRADWL